MKEAVYHIGRNKNSNEIYVFNETVSSSHAQIIIDENGDLIIIDLSSKNGISVNNEKIFSPVKLFKDDIITIGEFKCTQADLLNSIKVFDFKNQKPGERSVPLRSSLDKQIIKAKKKKIMNKKIVFTTLLLFGLIIVAFASTVIADQISIKKRIKKSTTAEKITDTSNATIEPIIEFKKQRTDVTYNFSCLASNGDRGSTEAILVFGELTRNVQNSILKDVDISIKDEKKAGDDLIEELKKDKKFITKGRDYDKLCQIMNNLTSRLADPRGVDYDMFFVDDTIKNVFTLGGNIIFYRGMHDFCISESELAAIISHEIAHNELGHSTLALKKQRTANNFGIFGDFALLFESMVSASFNQKQETEADLFGMDIMDPTLYENCDAINLWKRMSENENEFNLAENFFRSHPYSSRRANCVEHHLESNYNQKCNN